MILAVEMKMTSKEEKVALVLRYIHRSRQFCRCGGVCQLVIALTNGDLYGIANGVQQSSMIVGFL